MHSSCVDMCVYNLSLDRFLKDCFILTSQIAAQPHSVHFYLPSGLSLTSLNLCLLFAIILQLYLCIRSTLHKLVSKFLVYSATRADLLTTDNVGYSSVSLSSI